MKTHSGMRTTRGIVLSLFLLTVLLSVRGAAQGKEMNKPVDKPLYERLGGVYAIATVVDDFIERLLVNDVLNANAAIREARERVPKAGLKFQVTALVCQVTGGPQKYAGRTMKESHQHLNITEKEWQAMASDFKKTLDTFKVPEKEQQELFTIIGSTKGDIVVTGTSSR
ncbi:MAG TPA: group 1 truncated hemoglobin [Bacteroidota bacterium]|nr:group 1 truncated hemoglobin [Bacteroidota bacterium]